jgi:hypothetical protein
MGAQSKRGSVVGSTVRRTAAVAAAFAMALVIVLGLPAAHAATAVGEVSLAIGTSRIISDRGNAPVTRGMSVMPGDRIETDRGGHVHLRFVDGAYVSVRPGSRLTIEAYVYDPAKPQDNAVRFRLESGVARAISGRIAESARERFRLNTPIAAIGVRGTDFVVLAEPNRVRAAVHTGAIVLAPIGEGCQMTALGPCATAMARTLSADMGQVMVELNAQQGAPRIVPINGVSSPDKLSPPAPQEPRSSAGGTHVASETTTEVLAAKTVTEQVQVLKNAVPPPLPLPPATLVWGRWASAPLLGDTLSQSHAEASDGRNVTVGNDYYGLFRPSSSLSGLVTNLGKVDFSLRDAQVHLLRGSSVELGQVTGGSLSVDFTSRQFATGLSLTHPDVGPTNLQASGAVREDGMFVGHNPDGRVAGALTLDGKEAGYFFEKFVPGGMFMGVTRWGR